VQIAGRGKAQGPLQRDLAWRVVGQVLAADDVGDGSFSIVDDDKPQRAGTGTLTG
jgi:hypothetical protein